MAEMVCAAEKGSLMDLVWRRMQGKTDVAGLLEERVEE